MPVLHIDTTTSMIYAKKLEQLRRSALPSAIRNTLNAAALDVKTNTMISESDTAFKKRKPTFFRATSRTEFATGFEITAMRSVVGFVAPDNIKESGHATRDLEQQEHGGDIDKRAFIATDKGRTGKGNVKAALTMHAIKGKIVNASENAAGHNDKQKFVLSAIHAGKGGFVIGTGKNGQGNKALLKIMSIKRKGADTVVNSQEVYSVKAHRHAHVGATHFMEKASDESAKKMNDIFIKQAQFQINKVMKK
jgi:hypothetical protein